MAGTVHSIRVWVFVATIAAALTAALFVVLGSLLKLEPAPVPQTEYEDWVTFDQLEQSSGHYDLHVYKTAFLKFQSCETDFDCTALGLSVCPVGCSPPVNVHQVEEALEFLKSTPTTCRYRCLPLENYYAACEAGFCVQRRFDAATRTEHLKIH